MKRTIRQFLVYGFLSATALGLEIGCLYILTSLLGINYLISATICFCTGLVCMYFASKRWVFVINNELDPKTEFAIFFLIGSVGLLINNFILWFLVSQIGIHYIFGKLVAAGFVFFWNFIGRYILFTSPVSFATTSSQEDV